LNTLYKRKLAKIFKKLNNIASEGSDNIIEYYKYIDELIQKGDYSAFEEVITLKFDIDISRFNTVVDFRDLVWDRICFKTNSKLINRIQSLYKKNGIYQQANNIFKEEDIDPGSNQPIQPIGQINESDISTNDFNFLLKNKMYARLIGERIIELEVIKDGISYKIPNDDIQWDNSLNYDNNILRLYEYAVEILLGESTTTTTTLQF
jgi:hypothetical protein